MAPRDQMAGIVVSAGKMMKTVKVQLWKQEWNKQIRKNFSVPYKVLVNDPNNSVIEGDVITMAEERHSKRVAHTVQSIVAPFGKPLEERPPLFSQHERDEKFRLYKATKLARRREREGRAVAPTDDVEGQTPVVPDKDLSSERVEIRRRKEVARKEKESRDVEDAVKAQSVSDLTRALKLHKYEAGLKDLDWHDFLAFGADELQRRGVATEGARRKMLRGLEQVRTA